MSGRILVGSCSWTDPTLIRCGRFYPKGVTSAATRLRYYAAQFPIVEIDSTYYSPPTLDNAIRWAERTPESFTFDVKAFGLLTGHAADAARLPQWLRDAVLPKAAGKRRHYAADIDPAAMELLWAEHRKALAPLADAGKLGAVLFQFPPWFRRSHTAADYLRELPGRLPGLRLAVEFRGGGWMEADTAAETLRLLEGAGLCYVSVDEPQGFGSSTPPVAAATGGLSVVRLHGRNAATWQIRSGAASGRFKYLYRDDELLEWVPHVRELAERAGEAHVLFNNNYEDWGMRNARRMAQLLDAEGAGQTVLDLGDEQH